MMNFHSGDVHDMYFQYYYVGGPLGFIFCFVFECFSGSQGLRSRLNIPSEQAATSNPQKVRRAFVLLIGLFQYFA